MRCGAGIFTANDDTPVGRHEGNHNHAPDPVKVKARKMRQRLLADLIYCSSSCGLICLVLL